MILGAGASHDVRNRGSLLIDEDWQPPLAKDLFDIAEHPVYSEEVLNKYPGAHFLASLLAEEIASGEEGVEATLKKYAEHPDPQMREHFKQVPLYLRDLIFLASHRYLDVPGCYIQLVSGLLAQVPHRVLFIVLNYDTLLESALTYYNRDEYVFSFHQDYLADNRKAHVLKLHGSINWFITFGDYRSSWEAELRRLDVMQKPHDNDVMVADSITDAGAPYDGTESYIYPVITTPLAEKTLTDLWCPVSHQVEAQKFLRGCDKFLVIGTSGLDRDLFELLGSAVDTPEPFVHFVDNGEQINGTIGRFASGVEAFRQRYPESSKHARGFRNYVSGPHFTRFLEAMPHR